MTPFPYLLSMLDGTYYQGIWDEYDSHEEVIRDAAVAYDVPGIEKILDEIELALISGAKEVFLELAIIADDTPFLTERNVKSFLREVQRVTKEELEKKSPGNPRAQLQAPLVDSDEEEFFDSAEP